MNRKCRNITKGELILVITLGLFSLLSSLVCGFANTSFAYTSLLFLPLGFGIITFFFVSNFRGIFYEYNMLIMYGLYFVKDVVTPMIITIGGYNVQFKDLAKEKIDFAIALMLYEYLIISLFVLYKKSKFHGEERFKKKIFVFFSYKLNWGIFAVACLVIFCICAYGLNAQIRNNYLTIFELQNIVHLSGENIYEPGSFSRVVYTLFVMFFPIALMCMVALLITKCRKRFGDTMVGMFYSCIYLLLFLLFIPEELGFVIICCVAVVCTIFEIYPKSRNILLLVGGCAFLIIVIAIYLAKVKTTGINSSAVGILGNMLQAYFPGVANVAGIAGFQGTVPKLTQFLYELYNAVPFKTTLFGVVYDRIVLEYCQYNHVYYQIIPCIAQSYYFYGFLLAPIEPLILINISRCFFRKAKSSKNTLKILTYIFISIYSVLTTGMYNSTIFLSRFVNAFIPMLIIAECSYLTFKKNVKKLEGDQYDNNCSSIKNNTVNKEKSNEQK